jgi:DNA-binding response OmpR family regulator
MDNELFVSSPGNYRILVVDDIPDNVTMLTAHLASKGYQTLKAFNGIQALRIAVKERPDLIMLDVNMPQLSGLDICAQLKQREETENIPVILVTAHSDAEDIVRGFEVGADDYLIKPYNYLEMLARVRSMLRIRESQAQLRAANHQLDELNQNLEAKVKQQVGELERVNKLRRFFSPQIVETIVSADAEDILKEHSREISVVFLDLRRFTPFAEQNTPQMVIQTVRSLHHVVGPIIFAYGGTLERFTGDGMMVFLGDPEPIDDYAEKAVRMGLEIRDAVRPLSAKWAEDGYDLKLGIGIATGVASMGSIGFEGRMDYAAIGTVTNLAARMCGKAAGEQILIDQTTADQLPDGIEVRPHGEVSLKGFKKGRKAFEVV